MDDALSRFIYDGSNNLFTFNFYSDHDNTDSDNDGIADTPYAIDGSANNNDSSPSASPILLGDEIEDIVAQIKISPQTLNLKSKGNWVNVFITLPEDYFASDINASSVCINGEIYAISAQVIDSRTLKIKFDRQQIISYLKSQDLTGEVELNITGLLNGNTVSFNGVVQFMVI